MSMVLDKKSGLFLPSDTVRKLRNSGYGDAGASYVRRALKGFNASSGSPHDDIDDHNYTLRQRSRMLYMAAPIATSAIKTMRTNAVGVGLQLKSRVDRDVLGLSEEAAATWQTRVGMEFKLWASHKRHCDAAGVNDLDAIAQLVFSSWLLSGDAFVLLIRGEPTHRCPVGLRLQVVEADRVSTPTDLCTYKMQYTKGKAKNGNEIYDGVEVDKHGAVVAYYVCDRYPCERTLEKANWTRVEAYGKETGEPNILHIMCSERPGQYRGVPFLAPVIEPLLQLRRYAEAEVAAAVVQSMFTAFVVSDPVDPTTGVLGEVDSQYDTSHPHDNDYKLGSGTMSFLRPGEDLKFADPTRPNSAYESFTTSQYRQVGSGLEIPSEVLLKSFDASYSASRASMLEFWKSVRMYRQWFVSDFYRPVYETWLSETVARGRVAAPGYFVDPLTRQAWLGSEWIGPSQGQIDPVKEVTAEALAIELGISTHEQSTVRVNGGSWEDNVARLKRERELLDEANGVDANAAPPAISQPVRDTFIDVVKDVLRGE